MVKTMAQIEAYKDFLGIEDCDEYEMERCLKNEDYTNFITLPNEDIERELNLW